MLTPSLAHVSQDLNGFLHIKSALSASLLERLSTALDRRERAESPGPMLQGPDAEPFRELLVHPAIVPALNTILGAGFRLASGPSLGSEDKTEFHGGAVERSHGGNYEGYFWRGDRMFSGRVVVEVSIRLVTVLPAGAKSASCSGRSLCCATRERRTAAW